MFKKWCLLSAVFAICVLLTGCGGSDKPPNFGMTTEEFISAYNKQMSSDASLQIASGNLKQDFVMSKVYDKKQKGGYAEGNYNRASYSYTSNSFKLSFLVDTDTNKIFQVIASNSHVNYGNMDSTIKVFQAVVNALGGGSGLAEKLKLDNLRQYRGNNRFDSFAEGNSIACYFSFYYIHPDKDLAQLHIVTKESTFADSYRKQKFEPNVVPFFPNRDHTIAPPSVVEPRKPAQQAAPQASRPPQQAAQPAKPKPQMKKTIPGTKPINGFWEGNPKYPLIAMNNTMTKIADKESATIRKDGNDEVVTIDVYGFTKKDGQCWQETFTYRRKGGPTVRFSSIAQPDPFPMESAHDSAVKEAYKIACEAVGVPLVRQRDTTTF